LQDLLEPRADLHQSVLVTPLAGCSCPETNSVESLPDVDNNTHDLIVTFILKRLTNGSELGVEPELIDVDELLVLELVGPFAAMLVLLVLPFWSDTFLEEMVVRLDC